MRSSSSSSPRRGRLLALALLALAALVGAGCSAAATPAPTAAGAVPTISGAWVRPAAKGGQTAAYMTIAGAGQMDALTAVAVTFAASAEVHQTTSMSGMMGMSAVEKIDIPAGQAVKLEPGGYHVMIMNLSADLKAGDTVELTLTFQRAGKVTIKAEVKNG